MCELPEFGQKHRPVVEDLRDLLGRGQQLQQMDLLAAALVPGPGLGEVHAHCNTVRIRDCVPHSHVVVLAEAAALQLVDTSPEGCGAPLHDERVCQHMQNKNLCV